MVGDGMVKAVESTQRAKIIFVEMLPSRSFT